MNILERFLKRFFASLRMTMKEASLRMTIKEASLRMTMKEASLRMMMKEASLKMMMKEASLRMMMKEASLRMMMKEASLRMMMEEASLRMTGKGYFAIIPILNNRAFSLMELMMAVAFSALLMTGVFSFYNAANQSYSSGISGQSLEDGANIVINKIIKGEAESGTVYRLETSGSFYIPNNNPNILYFCQYNPYGTPCSPADSTVRSYTLDATNTKVLYYHPTSNPLGYDVIYTAPAGSSFFNAATNSKTLRFSYAQSNGTTLPNVVEIDVALTPILSANITNSRMINSGAASTFVLLRNHI